MKPKAAESGHQKEILLSNKIFSHKYTLLIACILITLTLFFALNYILNCVTHLPQLFGDAGNSGSYFGPGNLFIFRASRWPFYLAFLAVIAFVNARFVYRIRTSLREYNVNQKGSARWTELKEIQVQYRSVPMKTDNYEGKGGIPICQNKYLIYIDDEAVNNLIIGLTRSGKGEMFIFSAIDLYSRAEIKPSMVITDPKLELCAASYETLKKRGFDVHVLNLVDPLHSMGFNPLQLIIDAYKIKNYSEAEMLCNSFCYSIYNPDEGDGDSQFWSNNSTYMLSALILAHIDDCLSADERENALRLIQWAKRQKAFDALPEEEQAQLRSEIPRDICAGDFLELPYIPSDYSFIPSCEHEKQITMYSIVNTFSELARQKVSDHLTALDIYFQQRPPLDRAKLKYAAIEVAGDRTKGSIFSNTLSKLTIFTFEEIARMTAESTVNLRDIGFGHKPIALFLGIPDYDKSNHFIASVFIRQLYFALAKNATKERSGKCSREVVFLLDEFGNLPAIENMGNIITVCLGRNIRFNLVIQSYAQIEKLYGKDSETIIGNCGNQIHILNNDLETAEHFSKLIGSETITNVSRTGERLSTRKAFTEMYEEKPLINPNELMELKPGECVIKRVIKRTDLRGNHVTPTPIFNRGDTRFLYRHEYLLKDFPSGVHITDVSDENTGYIDIRSRTFDIARFFASKMAEVADEGKIIDPLDIPLKDMSEKNKIITGMKELGVTPPDPERATVFDVIRELMSRPAAAGELLLYFAKLV